MKSGRLLHGELSAVVARMGHTDALVIGDAGLPIPPGPQRIDLALTPGTPTFLAVLETVLEELRVERVLLAEELRERNPAQLEAIERVLAAYGERTGARVRIDFSAHEALKLASRGALAAVRTGECSPYSNVILYSGVIF